MFPVDRSVLPSQTRKTLLTVLAIVALVAASGSLVLLGAAIERPASEFTASDDNISQEQSNIGAENLASAGNVAASGTSPARGSVTLLVAGDIASCSSDGDEATAAILDRLDGVVIALGDNAYDSGTAKEFSRCYDPTWGRHKHRTRPAVGNHEYRTEDTSGYFGYFGDAAGDPDKGYYSFDLGNWHLIAINSNCYKIGGCGPGSPQLEWLTRNLAEHPAACTLAYWHHARFSSSSEHGSDGRTQAIWEALYQAGADVVLVAHDHTYERFAPLDDQGQPDPEYGIRQFVVGTGGRSHYRFGKPLPGSEVRESGTFGVLKLTLNDSGYDWAFIPVEGETFTDAGSDRCH